MDKKEFNKIVKSLSGSVAGMTKEEKEYLFSCLGIEEEDIKIQGIESFIELASIDEKMVEKYGTYIDEYYKLPMKNRRNVCKTAYKYFQKDGSLNIDVICNILIPHEACVLDKEVDPVVEAISEANGLIKKKPEINTTGIRYE